MTIQCNLDGKLSWRPETDDQPASVGRICAWGGFVIAEISNEVPEGERDEYARKFAAAEDLYEALEQAVTSMQDSGYPNSSVVVRSGKAVMEKYRGES